jgi:hypothetical protein
VYSGHRADQNDAADALSRGLANRSVVETVPEKRPFGNKRELRPKILVGVAGFEPATPSSRTKCATRLRYTPT